MRYFLENNDIKVEIDSFGAEIKSVINKNNMREYMWYGNPKFWGRTSPVLFPFVGSLKDKKYTWKGKEYDMGQHGFARDNEFEFVSQTEDEIWFRFKSNLETLVKYPFEFVLEIGYKIESDNLMENESGKQKTSKEEREDERKGMIAATVKVMWRIFNPSNDTMYFSIGAHPAFLCPIHGFDTTKKGWKDGYKLYFEGVDKIHHHGNDVASGLALREDIELPLDNGYATITTDFFDRCTYMIEGNQTGCVGIADEEGNLFVDVCFDAPLFAVWSPEGKNAPFICIEPWFGRCDAVDFDGDLSEREYTNVLEAGETFENGYTMRFYDYK